MVSYGDRSSRGSRQLQETMNVGGDKRHGTVKVGENDSGGEVEDNYGGRGGGGLDEDGYDRYLRMI